MQDADDIEARLREVSSVPETLAASFYAFEVIRLAARAHEDQVPGLFASFMTTADAAVTGREALTIPPSPAASAPPHVPAPPPAPPLDLITPPLTHPRSLLP